jgi:hypothetical protein
MLRRYWIEWEHSPEERDPYLRHGCGVTAFDKDDALQLVKEKMFPDEPLPPVSKIIEDVDVSTLDQGHVIPNMHPPVWRGVWFPKLEPLG